MKANFTVRNQSDVYIASASQLLPELLGERRVVVITDASMVRLYGSLIAPYEMILVGQGESSKTLHTIEQIYRKLIELGADRRTFILGIGGGIVTDMAGFAASTYMRGLEFGFVSTTLLGQVDASVGGKNGVNVGGFKNMAGCFSQPRFVICDPEMLTTLPEREFRAGLAEVIKSAIIADKPLFERLEQSSFEELRTNKALLAEVVASSVGVKAAIVERDEREGGERRLLNLGHTLGHAIEKSSREMIHGEAVAVGVVMMARMAQRMGLLAESEADRIQALFVRMGFVLRSPVSTARLKKPCGKDKKSEADKIHIVLPTAIGRCECRLMEKEKFTALF